MKKLLFMLVLSLLIPPSIFAADSPITGLPANTTVDDADLIVLEDDPVGTPETQKMTVIDLFDTIDTSSKLSTILTDETGSGTTVFGNAPTIATPNTTGKVTRNGVAVDDDSCVGEQGLWWYDTTDSRFEWCNANSGAPAVIPSVIGDITDVYDCASGDCNAIIVESGDTLKIDPGGEVHATETVIAVNNDSGATLYSCTPVYISGFDIPSNLVEVSIADSNANMPAVGLVEDDIANGANGNVVIHGTEGDWDTATGEGWTVGDALYVNDSGTAASSDCGNALTNVRPANIDDSIQQIGEVVRVHATQGQIAVSGAGRSNDVPNLEDAKFWLGNGSNVATAVSMSSDATMNNAGAITIADSVVVSAWTLNGVTLVGGGAGTHTINGASVDAQIEVHSEGAANLSGQTIHRHADGAVYGSSLSFLRSNNTHASPSVVVNGDALARICAIGFDGTDYATSSEIKMSVDATPGNDDMPGQISFLTSQDGAQTLTEGARIDDSQWFLTTHGIDGIGAVDMDYGSADITDHTFTTDSTGDSEIVLPDDSIGPAEIDSTTGAYDFGGVTSLAIPHGAAPTVNATGEVAVDTNLYSSAQGCFVVYDGTQQGNGVCTTDTPGDNESPKFDAATGTVTWEADSGGGDVTGVGDCTDGDCLDGTSDGGTEIAFYDGNSNKQTLSSGDLSGDISFILPVDDGDASDVLTTNGSGTLSWAAGGGGSSGFFWVMQPQRAKLPASNPMTIDAGNLRWRGLFDDTTEECAQWETYLRPYNGGTLSAKIAYTLETTSTSDVVAFNFHAMCVSDGDSQDVDSDSFLTADDIDSGAISTTAGYLDILTDSNLASASALCSEDDLFIVKICRDVVADGTTDDVELRKITIFE